MATRSIEEFTGTAAVVRGDDIDTDRIIPARFMKVVTFDTVGEHLFEDDRKAAKGDHALDDERFTGASILLVNKNFGCGSSREHAPQALMRYGFQAFIGESFAEIFAGNCTALGLICAPLAEADLRKVMDSVELDPTQQVAIDIREQTVTYRGGTVPTAIDPGTRQQLLEATWDATGLLLDAGDAIEQTAKRLPYIEGFAE
jgi:3-isopropylmalate/(R)-2-methylmalate dehydratase small subunit